MALFVLSLCPFDISVGVGAFVIGLSQISSFFSNVVEEVKQKSISDASELEQTRSHGDAEGIAIMTDARHACRKNSFHSDVLALGVETHKIVAHVHVTKDDARSSRKHELFGTKKMYDILDDRGVKVIEHAHNRNISISKFLSEDHPDIRDSYDSWHSAKEVRKGISKITKGLKRSIGVTWHTELSDKLAGIKTHVYWAMKNCAGNAQNITQALDNISEHYQNRHGMCHPTSGCKRPGYIPSRTIVTSPVAVNLLQNAIKQLFIYKHPEKYVTCRDTHYVESCNNTFLIYVDKRIHFKGPMYKLRTGLAVLDWNEHVYRPVTSVTQQVRAQNPRRLAPKRILSQKTFNFVRVLWQRFCQRLIFGPLVHNNCNIPDSDSEQDDDSDSDDDMQ